MDDDKKTDDLIKKIDAMIAEINDSSKKFKEETAGLIKSLNEGIDALEKDFSKTEKELTELDEKTIGRMDEVLLNSLIE